MKSIKYFFTFCLINFLFIGCNSDDAAPINQEELITTIEFSFTPDGVGDSQTFTFKDLDGDGGSAPFIDTIFLNKNTNYLTSLTFLDESASPAEDITAEILEEALDHQVFYSSDIDLIINYNDQDSEGNPLGLETAITVGDIFPLSGGLTIILRHEPNKSGIGVADGDIANAGGETDIEVTFPVVIIQ
jgi:hypothetical protein